MTFKTHCKCGADLVPHPDTVGVPAVGADDAYLICSTNKCGHHGVDHEYQYPSLWSIIKNRGKEIVTCRRTGCLHRHFMWQGY